MLMVLLAACLRVGFERERFLLNWAYTHYLFNYRDEFVKRGLVGEILRLLPIDVTYSFLQIFTIALLAIFCLIFAVFLFFLLIKSANKYAGLLLVLLVGLSPVALQHFIFDIGRFDIISYSLLLLLLGYLLKVRHGALAVTSLLVAAFIVISLLIHEANFFMVVPLSLACWYCVSRGMAVRILQLAMLVIALLITYLISTHGAYGVLEHEAHLQALRAEYGPWVVRSSLRVIHAITLQDNVLLTMWHVLNVKHALHHLGFFIVSVPFAVLLWRLCAALKPILNRSIWVVLIAVFAPLLLYPLGLDHFRWWSLSLFNLLLLIGFISLSSRDAALVVEQYLLKNQWLVWSVIVLGLLLGPLKTMISYAVVESLLVDLFGF